MVFSHCRGTVAHKIMQKYGFREGQGLGKHEQGLSTALSVEKTSKRGGKIIIGESTEKGNCVLHQVCEKWSSWVSIYLSFLKMLELEKWLIFVLVEISFFKSFCKVILYAFCFSSSSPSSISCPPLVLGKRLHFQGWSCSALMAFSLSHPVNIALISLLLSDLKTTCRLLSTSGGSQNTFTLVVLVIQFWT